MATIKLEILLDSQTDAEVFLNLMHAFSGSPAIQITHPGNGTTVQELKSQKYEAATEEDKNSEYTEQEMLKMANSELKEYATGLGIDWANTEGKNTNRKLADLILAYRNTNATNDTKAADDVSPDQTDENSEDLAEDQNNEDNLEGVTFSDLKMMLSKKVDDHRPAIVEKLAEFGAERMPDLKEEDYEEMYNFLKAL